MSREKSDDIHKEKCAEIYNGCIDSVVSLANEPSVGLFRIQEHIRKTAPQISEDRATSFFCAEKLKGINFDLDNNLSVLSTLPKVEANLFNLAKILDTCIVNQQRRKNKEPQDPCELGVDVVALLTDDA